MPHNRFFVDTSFTLDSHLTLPEEESYHIIKVMRLQVGESFELINGKGFLAEAKLESIGKKDLVCSISKLSFTEKPKNPWIIAQAFLKPSSLELLVEKNTELGMDQLWLFPAYYSEKSDLSSNQEKRLYAHRVSAIKQCGRLYLPTIRLFDSLEKLCEVATKTSSHLFYGDIDPKAPKLLSCLYNKQLLTPPIFFIGPEQGFYKKEELLLKKFNVQAVSLNPNILRAETASMTASALLAHI
ncbi:MAG: RsmE family RNA methyltransferase [Chlamydiota bacterium]